MLKPIATSLCSCPPNFRVETWSRITCNRINGRGSGWWPNHVSKSLRNRIICFRKKAQLISLFFLPRENTGTKHLQKRMGPHRQRIWQRFLWSWTSYLLKLQKISFGCFCAVSLWNFRVEAWTDEDSVHQLYSAS